LGQPQTRTRCGRFCRPIDGAHTRTTTAATTTTAPPPPPPRYLEDPAFLNYLKHLEYFRQPQYARYIKCARGGGGGVGGGDRGVVGKGALCWTRLVEAWLKPAALGGSVVHSA